LIMFFWNLKAISLTCKFNPSKLLFDNGGGWYWSLEQTLPIFEFILFQKIRAPPNYKLSIF